MEISLDLNTSATRTYVLWHHVLVIHIVFWISWTSWTFILTNPIVLEISAAKWFFSGLVHLSFLFLEMAPNWQIFVIFENTPKGVKICWTILFCFFLIRASLLGLVKRHQGTSGPVINTREINALVCWCHLFKIHALLQVCSVKDWYFTASITWLPAFIKHMVNIFWQCQGQAV